MLSPSTPWLSNAYKAKSIHDERNAQEIEELAHSPKEKGILKSRPSSPCSPKKKATVVTAPRARSAPPRSRRSIDFTGSNNNSRPTSSTVYTRNRPTTSGLSVQSSVVHDHRPVSAQTPSRRGINFYTRQITTRTIDKAAFRQRPGSARLNPSYSSARPDSGRMRATRPLGQTRTAWAVNNDEETTNPNSSTNTNVPSKQNFWQPINIDDYLICTSPTSQLNSVDRNTHPSPANSETNLTTIPMNYDSFPKRPTSSQGYSPGPMSIQAHYRVKSPASMRTNSANNSRPPTPEDNMSQWLEDPRIGLSVGFQSDPGLLYFDRHSRCFDNNHLHHPLNQWRPQQACENSLDACGDTASLSRPNSALGLPGQSRKVYTPVQRFIDCHRPKTAPYTRKELQKYGGTAQHSDYLPHYCNFVHSVRLHEKLSTNTPAVNNNDDDEVDDGYITNTELSPTEADDGKKNAKNAKVKTATDDDSSKLAGPITRATSPGSTGYDPESLFERLREEGLAGSTSALNTTAHDTTLGEDEELDLDPEVEVEIETEDGSREVRTQTPHVEILLRSTPSPVRQPITIPSTDDVSKDHDVTDSARTPKSKNGKDPAALFNKLTSETTKEAKTSARSQPASGKVKGRRSSCAKKEKMPLKDKKKKGKKKEKGEETEENKQAQEATQVSEHKEDGSSVPAESISIDVKVPDLPTVGTTTKGSNKKKGRKTSKTQIVAPKAPEKPKVEPTITETPAAGFYDFGDLTLAAAQEEMMMKQVITTNYLNDRMVLSLQSSRFELPMDMRVLEKMSPQEYLRKHCIVSNRRKTLYQKMFAKYKDKQGNVQGFQMLGKALKEVLVNTISTEQVAELCDLLEITDETLVDIKLFAGVAALAERILYPDFLTEDTADRSEYQREKVECADFCSLEWKLHGLEVNGHVRKLLEALS